MAQQWEPPISRPYTSKHQPGVKTMSRNSLERGRGRKGLADALPAPTRQNRKGAMSGIVVSERNSGLLQRLIDKQNELRLTDVEFAKQMRVSRKLWQATRTGRLQIGDKMLSGVFNLFMSGDFEESEFGNVIKDILAYMGENPKVGMA